VSGSFPQGAAYLGHNNTGSDADDFQSTHFMIQRMISRVQTLTLAKVVSCSNAGGLSAIGTVSVQPMVAMLDGYGNAMEHGTLVNLPYMRIQGGSNAIILDPQPGDVGLVGFCSRDISSVKNTGQVGVPGSKRAHSMSDGVYIMSVYGGSPTQYVRFANGVLEVVTPDTVHIKAGTSVVVDSPVITLNGMLNQGTGSGGASTYAATLQGPLTVVNDVLAGGSALSLLHHLHGGVQTGGGKTAQPTNT
jgi:hypothetical protein